MNIYPVCVVQAGFAPVQLLSHYGENNGKPGQLGKTLKWQTFIPSPPDIFVLPLVLAVLLSKVPILFFVFGKQAADGNLHFIKGLCSLSPVISINEEPMCFLCSDSRKSAGMVKIVDSLNSDVLENIQKILARNLYKIRRTVRFCLLEIYGIQTVQYN